MSQLRIGISGWRYEPWRRVFYPPGLAQRRELEFASRQLNSIEVNGSFYSLQDVTSWQRWYSETPEDFVFSVKGSRFITHMKRLKRVEQPLANFFAQGVLALKEKLGPILWQFPPAFTFDLQRFEEFFKLLPQNMEEAVKLARRHDERMAESCWFRVDKVLLKRPVRHAVEIRHESFQSEKFLEQLQRCNIALVLADTAGKWPFIEKVTSDFIYARLHGDRELYASGYTPSALDRWAKRVRTWRRKRLDVYVYFDNDVKVRAPFDAVALARRAGGFLPTQPMGKFPRKVKEEPRPSW